MMRKHSYIPPFWKPGNSLNSYKKRDRKKKYNNNNNPVTGPEKKDRGSWKTKNKNWTNVNLHTFLNNLNQYLRKIEINTMWT